MRLNNLHKTIFHRKDYDEITHLWVYINYNLKIGRYYTLFSLDDSSLFENIHVLKMGGGIIPPDFQNQKFSLKMGGLLFWEGYY